MKPHANFFSGGGRGSFFVDKYNATGTTRIFSTIVGGSAGDVSYAMAVDSAGAAYVGGHTESANLPVSPGLRIRSPYHACSTTPPHPCDTTTTLSLPNTYTETDGYIFKLNPSGSGIAWSTYLGGGSGLDFVRSLALSSNGMLYAAGSTNSPNNQTVHTQPVWGRFIGFPTTANAFVQQPASDPGGIGVFDQGRGGLGFFTALSAASGQISYSTLIGVPRRAGQVRIGGGSLGNSGQAYATSVAALPNGHAVVVGVTNDSEFITCNQCLRLSSPRFQRYLRCQLRRLRGNLRSLCFGSRVPAFDTGNRVDTQ